MSGIGLFTSRIWRKKHNQIMSKLKVDLIQEKQIRLLFYLVATMGAVTTLMLFFQNRKNRKEKDELLDLEKELKTLQLEKLRKEKRQYTQRN